MVKVSPSSGIVPPAAIDALPGDTAPAAPLLDTLQRTTKSAPLARAKTKGLSALHLRYDRHRVDAVFEHPLKGLASFPRNARALMLEMADGTLLTPHTQPLHVMVRFPNEADVHTAIRWETSDELAAARRLVDTIVHDANVAQRFARATRVVLLPAAHVPDIAALAAWDTQLPNAAPAPVAAAKMAHTNLPISALTPATLESACTLLERVFPHDAPALGLRASLDPAQHAALEATRRAQGLEVARTMEYRVVVRDGRVVGNSGLYTLDRDAHQGAAWLGWFAIAPEERGNGLGSALLQHTIAEARARGFTTLKLYTTDSDNEAKAQGLFEAHGLRITGYAARGDDGEKLVYRELPL